jgi:hypothetical protein
MEHRSHEGEAMNGRIREEKEPNNLNVVNVLTVQE